MAKRVLLVVLAVAIQSLAAAADDQAASASVSLIIGGDVMLDGDPGHAVNHGADPFVEVADWLSTSDLAVCNLECVISDKGRVAHKPYTFRGAARSLPILKKHFHAVSLANNHTLDFGIDGFVGQLEKLEEAKLPYFGGGRTLTAARQPLILAKNGFRIALLGYNGFHADEYAATDSTPGVAPLKIELIEEDIHAALEKERVDIVIPYVHWGPELVSAPTESQRVLARKMIDAGASAVIGAHPHVTQTVEIYKGRPIVYSLGNLVFDYFPDDPPVWTGWLSKLTFSRSGPPDLELFAFEIDHLGFPRKIRDE